MVDLEALALLVPPHGEGTVALRTALFVQLLDELRELRARLLQATLDPPDDTTLTPGDVRDLAAIRRAAERDGGDPLRVVRLIGQYYRNGDRADRAPRGVLYVHLGMLLGLLANARDGRDERPQG